jgi:hypothetical protein
MKYKKGSTQYASRTLKRGDNIRLYSWITYQLVFENTA